MQTTATAPLDVDALLALGRKGTARPFITAASAMLLERPELDELRLLLVRHLTEQGLLFRAAAYARGFSSALCDVSDVSRMSKDLATVRNNGFLAWQQYGGRFQANLDALRERYAWADDIQQAWHAARARYELHLTRDGQHQVFERVGAAGGLWRPAFADHLPDGTPAQLAQQFAGKILGPLVVDQVALGLHVPWLYEATRDTFLGATPVIYVVEPSWVAMAVALHLSDWTALLCDERVRLCCGRGAHAELERAAHTDHQCPPPIIALRCLPHESSQAVDTEPLLVRVKTRIDGRTEDLRRRAEQVYAGRDAAWWARRYGEALSGTGAPLRALGITCRFTTVLKYSMRDALHGMQAAGCVTRKLIEPSNHARLTPQVVLRALVEFEPDLVFIIDHTRDGQQAGLVENVPVMTWIQDRLPKLFCRQAGEALGALDFCMGFGREELVRDFAYPAQRFMECEMATAPEMLRAPEDHTGRGAGAARYACDVAFATTHSRSPESLVEQYCAANPRLKDLLHATFEELRARGSRNQLNPGLDATLFMRQIERQHNIKLSEELLNEFARGLIRPLIDQLVRHQTIGWVADWVEQGGGRFHLYGRGWEDHPRFSKFARGFVPHGPELGRAFRGAKVNLHAGCLRAFHQRVLDVLSAGGALLIRYNAEDFTARVSRTVLELIRDRGLQPGDSITHRDLDPPIQDLWLNARRVRGADVNQPILVNQQHLAQLDRLADPDFLRGPADVWPDLGRITFDSRAELFSHLNTFLGDDELRRSTFAAMRARMLERFSYQALMKRMIDWLARTLRTG